MKKSAHVSLRLPTDLLARVRAFAKGLRSTPSAALRLALARGLKMFEQEAGFMGDARKKPGESLLKHLRRTKNRQSKRITHRAVAVGAEKQGGCNT